MIQRIAHVCLGASDLEATRRFYIEGLGFKKGFDFVRNGEIIGFYAIVAPGSFIEVFRDATPVVDRGLPIKHFCLECGDLDGLRTHLTGLGYAVTEKKLGADHSWQMWTTDPGGVRIEFHQYTDKSCQFTGEPCVLN